MRSLKSLLLPAIVFLCGIVPAQALNPFAHDSVTKADTDPVMLTLDSMSYELFTRGKFYGNTEELMRSIAMTKEQLPSYSPDEMKRRMKLIPSLISMDYNSDVQAFIDLFVYRRRDLMTKLLANAQIYFPLFEEILDKNKMPGELKYLPVIESALNPQAVSPAGATGLWQLMYGTGKMMGLESNSYYDERRDPHKSTIAGTKYLKQLYDMYGDWQLALAAYNSGPGYVTKAIARAGGVKNFWAIKNLLPAETRSYVPTYLAMVYVMHYAKDYKLVSAEPKRELYSIDTVMLPGKVSLKHIASTIGMSLDELQFLNPCLKGGVVPMMNSGCPLNIPVNYIATFESKKEIIINDPEMTAQAALMDGYANPTMMRVPRYAYYTVHRNDNINQIAARYGVSVAEIREWNHMRGYGVARGQKLKILTFVEVPTYQAQTAAVSTAVAPNPSARIIADTSKVDVAPQSPTTASTETASANNSEEVLYYYQKGAGGNTNVEAPASAASVKPAVSKPQATVAPVRRPVVKYYKVHEGDTLWGIVQHYPGLTIDKLKAANGISGRGLLKGQVLKIVL
jgi:membrane-bound lytic murein transglycosylase D